MCAYLDDNTVVKLNGNTFTKTDRTPTCDILCTTAKCSSCKSYRANVRAIYASWVKRSNRCIDEYSSSSHMNETYLRTPEKKAKLTHLKKRTKRAERKLNAC